MAAASPELQLQVYRLLLLLLRGVWEGKKKDRWNDSIVNWLSGAHASVSGVSRNRFSQEGAGD